MLVVSPEQFYVTMCSVDRFYEAIDLTIAAYPQPDMTRDEQGQMIIREMLAYWPPAGTC